MLKKVIFSSCTLFAVTLLASTQPQLAKNWQIDFRENVSDSELLEISRTGKLQDPQTFQLNERGEFLANFNNMLTGVMVNEITAPDDGTYLLGICADWQITIFLNGEKIGVGRSTTDVTIYSRSFKVKLKKGKNILCVKMQKDFDKWCFAAGFLPLLDNFPTTSDLQDKILSQLPAKTPELTHKPYVTRVTSRSAAVGVIFSNPATAGLRLSDGREFWHEEHGLLPAKKNFLFQIDNLKPGVTYTYEILMQPNRRRPKPVKVYKGQFTTFPEKNTPHSFFIFSDTQLSNVLKRQLIEDSAVNCALKDDKFIVSLGDAADNMDFFEPVFFTYFLDALNAKGITAPFVPVRGNHECLGYQNYRYHTHFGRPYYAFRYGDVFYIVLDSHLGSAKLKGKLNQLQRAANAYFIRQAKWLDEVVKSPACTTAKYRVLFTHQPPVGSSMPLFKMLFGKHFLGKKPAVPIDLWFAAHTHAPYRHDPVNGKMFIAQSSPRHKRQYIHLQKVLSQIPMPLYVNDGPGSAGVLLSGIKVNFTGSAFEIKCLDPDGKVLDHVILTPGKGFAEKSTIWVEMSK